MEFELGTIGTRVQSSTTEPPSNLMNMGEISGLSNKVTFSPPDFPIPVPYFIYHSAEPLELEKRTSNKIQEPDFVCTKSSKFIDFPAID